MSTTTPIPSSSSDPRVDAAIASAERRLAMLERLTEIGMALAEEIGSRSVNAPYHPEPRHDPSRAFAAVSRAVRLTLALAARMEAEILAMRNDEPTPGQAVGDGGAAFVVSAPTPPVADFAPAPEESSCFRRAKVRDAVWEVIDHEIGDGEAARGARSRVHERLIEGEDYDAALSLSWRECVAAICADLGLSPDWSSWSDEEGFAPDETGAGQDRPLPWSSDPEQAEAERRQRAEPTDGGVRRVNQLE